MANNSQPGGDQFYSALQQKATAAVASILKSPLVSIQYPSQGDFMWNWENGNQVFNLSTYNYISALLSAGDFSNSAKLSSAGSFPNAYVQLLNTIDYTLSNANHQKLIQAQANATQQQQTVVTDYQNTYGPITAAQMTTANVTTKVDYVINYIMGTIWSGVGATGKPLTYTQMQQARNLQDLLPAMPASAQQIVADVNIYLDLMQPVLDLQDNLNNGTWTLKQLKLNTENPGTNSGMPTFDPNTAITGPVVDAYSISYPTASISNDLQNKGRTITLNMSTASASGSQLSVNVEGQTGFSVGSVLKFSVTGSSSYDMNQVKGTSNDCSITMTWNGYSVIPTAPLAWQQSSGQGWYMPDPINQAIQNGTGDVDGFKFIATVPFNLSALSDGGNFGLLTNLLIGNYPSVKITYQNADFASFKQAWSQQVSGNLTLFGFISLGSFSEGTYSSSFQEGSDNSSFSVTFGASPQIISVPQQQQTAFVIAGAVSTPQAAPAGSEVAATASAEAAL